MSEIKFSPFVQPEKPAISKVQPVQPSKPAHNDQYPEQNPDQSPKKQPEKPSRGSEPGKGENLDAYA